MCVPRSKVYRPKPPRSDRWTHPSRRTELVTVTLTVTRRRALWIGAGALAVAGSGVTWWQLFSGDASVRTLAVLPLANTQNDPVIPGTSVTESPKA